MRRLNLRFVIVLLICGLAVGAGGYWLHTMQSHRHAALFLEQARQAKEDEKPQEAVGLLGRYLELAPDDTGALAELGLLLADLSQYRRAYTTLEKVLRHDPERTDVRRRLVEVAITLRRYSDARLHLEKYLLETSPGDPDLLESLARCQAAAGDYALAAESLELVIQNAPERVDVYRHLAELLRRRLDRAEDADRVMDELVAVNPDSARAYVQRGGYLRALGRFEEAWQAAEKALELAPDDPDAVFLAGGAAAGRGQLDQARRLAKRGVELEPAAARNYRALAAVELQAGRPDEAAAWLRKGLEAIPADPDLLWKLATIYINQGRIEQAEQTVERLRAAAGPRFVAGFLAARIEYARGHWLAALRGFDQARPQLNARGDLLKELEFWVAGCYEHLGNTGEQLAAYRRSLDVDPLWVPARAGLAAALASAGQIDEALREQRQIAARPGAGARERIRLTQWLLAKNLRLPEAQRDWAEAEKALDEAAEATPEAAEPVIVRAEMLVAQGRADAAAEVLRKARDKTPDQPVFWIALARLAQRRGEWDEAARILDEAGQRLGDIVPLRLARAEYLVRRHGGEATGQLQKLSEQTERFSPQQRLQLCSGLLGAWLRIGNDEEAGRLCQLLAEQDPNNLHARLLLFELALRAEDASGMEAVLAEIERLEGKGPIWHFASAVRLRLLAAGGNTRVLKEAEGHLAEARKLRPKWSRVPALAGEISQLRGEQDAAIEHYRRAIELGGRNPGLVRRLIALLYRQHRYLEAERVIRQVEEGRERLSPELGRMASQLSLRTADFDRSVALARQVAAGSKDYRDHLWLGQVLDILARRVEVGQAPGEGEQILAEAEKSLREALRLAEERPEVWVALVRFLARNHRTQEAEAAIAQARSAISADQAPLALAQCYETLEKLPEAETHYLTALRSAPNDPGMVGIVADFYFRTGKHQEAQQQLDRIISGKLGAKQSAVCWARRRLASILAARPGYQNSRQALELIEQNLAADDSSLADRHAKAVLLAVHPQREKRRQAARILEQIAQGQQSLAAEDQFLLAQLYLAEGDWSKYRKQMRGVLAADGQQPRYVAAYLHALLRRNEIPEAELWLGRLEGIAGGQFSTVGLKAEMLVQQGRADQAVAAIKDFIDNAAAPPDRPDRLRLAAAALETLARRLEDADRQAPAARFLAEAEQAYRRYVEQRPEGQLLLAGFLGRQGRLDEALELAEETSNDAEPAAVAGLAATILNAEGPTPAQLERLENILLAALEKHDRPAAHVLLLADLRILQGQFQGAERLYREVLAKDSQNVLAMNNLAVLLALQRRQLDESLELIDRAIETAGPAGTLLDSRAIVHIARRQPKKALADLKAAIADDPKPTRYFHTAQAQFQLGEKTAADEALAKAADLGLSAEVLHPLERLPYRTLQAALD